MGREMFRVVSGGLRKARTHSPGYKCLPSEPTEREGSGWQKARTLCSTLTVSQGVVLCMGSCSSPEGGASLPRCPESHSKEGCRKQIPVLLFCLRHLDTCILGMLLR